MFSASDLFDLNETEHAAIFDGTKNAWEALGRIKAYVDAAASGRQQHSTKGRAYIDENVTIGEGTVVEDGAMILGPTIIGKNCQIRHNAYIRAYTVVGDNCVIGNSTEVKHSIVFNKCQIPHFNYVGDSILGVHAHMGAGVKISNLKLTPGTVMLDAVDQSGVPIDSGLRKFGALIGDRAEIGCNAVLNPGTVLGRDSMIYPGVSWRGVLPDHMIAKNKAPVDIVVNRLRTS